MKKEVLIKLIIVGDRKVGKTNLIKRFIDNKFDTYYYNTRCNY